jgi:hypothetical protein
MHVENLFEVGRVDPSNTLKGPWKTIEVRTLEEGGTLELQTTAAEYALFTMDGKGRLNDGQNPVELKTGVAITLTKGSHAQLQAIDGPMRFFMITFKL